MGFHTKTDYRSGRVLDLDKSYKNIIKPAVTAAGYDCIRADEIQHAGNINVPMYQQLLNADIVIADVSTYNENAFYELGVRHALKPHTTIIIAEDKLMFPFDIGQIAVRKYHHMGEDIGFDEALRMQADLKEAIKAIGAQAACDSPVYTFLRDLKPPAVAGAGVQSAAPSAATPAPAAAPAAAAANQPTVSVLMDQIDAAFKRSDFAGAKSLLTFLRTMTPNDVFVIQKLALATYKSKQPTPVDALNEACQMLESLGPANSTDTETLGLYGAVHKRLWEETKDTVHLDKAIWSLEKGFYVRNDYYNGINLAYMLNVRAALNADSAPAEAIADFVVAQRTRRRVLQLCQRMLNSQPAPAGESEFWIKATMSQAYAGLGDDGKAEDLLQQAKTLSPAPPQWMIDSTVDQLAKLRNLLTKSPLSRIK